jgi:predicted membrane protein (TIGR00267 family)
MHNPEQMLAEQVREELKIGGVDMSPMREAWITGSATAVGAFIPVLPFLLMRGTGAAVVSLVLSMLAHFAVGAARATFTGRGVVRSGMDMFVVGLGVAIVGYAIGDWLGRLL